MTTREILFLPLFALFCLSAFTGNVCRSEEGKAKTPPPGSQTRKEICDVLRGAIYREEIEDGDKVRFVISHLKVLGKWACLSGHAQVTPDRNEATPGFTAILRREESGKWKCLVWDFHGEPITLEELEGSPDVPREILPDWMFPENFR